MTDLLILHLFLAFVMGGAWVSSATLIAERFGSALGGLVGGLPAISIVSFLFIGLNQSPETASQATIVFPLALSFTMSFLLVYAIVSKRGFPAAFLAALLVWAILSAITALLNLRNLFFSVGVFLSVASFYFYILKVRMKLPHIGGAQIAYSFSQVAFRAVVGGSIVALAVLSSQIGGPEVGGIASSFPAIFSLTLLQLQNPWNGVVASLNETIAGICLADRVSVQPSRRISLPTPRSGNWNSSRIVLHYSFSSVGPSADQCQEDLR